eukprot:TRINITY_DN60123_c0_g1_i1.p2 TRINITY_DN60123_c0_g1~~TRINITY_DN60123_c0_g1_i1.p2  ORF type:complete len:637 (+),score=156.10 TRINITY_DN60123_c0_g1_i1:88-1998(+)
MGGGAAKSDSAPAAPAEAADSTRCAAGALSEVLPGVPLELLMQALELCGGGTEAAASELAGYDAEQVERWVSRRRGAPVQRAAAAPPQQGAAPAGAEPAGAAAQLCGLFPGLTAATAAEVLERCSGSLQRAAEVIVTRGGAGPDVERWLQSTKPSATAPAPLKLKPTAGPAQGHRDPVAQLQEIHPGAPPGCLAEVLARCKGDVRQATGVVASRLREGDLERWLADTGPVSPVTALRQATHHPDAGEVRRVLDLCRGDSTCAFDILSAPPERLRSFFHTKRTLDCPVCFDGLPADEMYCIGCGNEDHFVCHPCALDLAGSGLKDQARIQCPHKDCSYLLSDEDVRRMHWPEGDFKREVERHTEVLLKDSISKLKGVGCPTAGCPGWVELVNPTERLAVRCGRCLRQRPRPRTAVFCSQCRGQYHYHAHCRDVPRITHDWLNWCERDREPAHKRWRAEGRAVEAYEQQKRATAERNKELRMQYEQIRQDEVHKQGYRACPHCGAPFHKLDGCNMMHCAYCHQGFDENHAPYYRSTLPELRTEAEPPKATRSEPWTDWGVPCSGCKETIQGPRFQCVQCKAADYCHRCEERHSTSEQHRNHVFRILTVPADVTAQGAPAAAPQARRDGPQRGTGRVRL